MFSGCFFARILCLTQNVVNPTKSTFVFPPIHFGVLVLYPQLNASGLLGNNEISIGAAIACFLAQEGADINYANHKGKSPLDLVEDSSTLQLIKSFSEKHRYTRTSPQSIPVVFLTNPENYGSKTNIRLKFPATHFPPAVSAHWCSCTGKCLTVGVASHQVAAPAGHHMWTRPEQLQPAEGPHHAQHHDQPGPAHATGTQRMPHLLWAGSAGSLLSLPAQRGLRRWVETQIKRFIHPSVSFWRLVYGSRCSSCGLSREGCKSLWDVAEIWLFYISKTEYLCCHCPNRVCTSNEEMYQMPSHDHKEN